MHAYCLMGNHYHLLIETPRPNLALGMRQLNGVYAQHFNRRYRRVGHLFQGRYKAVLVERDSHLLELCRYIVLNPVRAHLCSHPARWPWSSYQATTGQSTAPVWLTTDWILSQFAPHRADAQERYQQFVADGRRGGPHTTRRPLPRQRPFIRRLSRNLKPLREIKRPQWQPLPPPLDELLTNEPTGIRTAHHTYGYTLTEIANHLGVHYATISRQLRQLEHDAKPGTQTP